MVSYPSLEWAATIRPDGVGVVDSHPLVLLPAVLVGLD